MLLLIWQHICSKSLKLCFSSLECIPRNGITEILSNSIFIFWGSTILLSTVAAPFYIPVNCAQASSLSMSTLALCSFSICCIVAVLMGLYGHLYCSWQVVTYLAGCGLQSCPMLLAKGYPDVGWNPIEGERYLSFLRFAVFVNSESHIFHAFNVQDGILMDTCKEKWIISLFPISG